MKPQTLKLLQFHLASKSLEQFSESDIREIVEAEYSKSLTQSVPDLFKIILTKAGKYD